MNSAIRIFFSHVSGGGPRHRIPSWSFITPLCATWFQPSGKNPWEFPWTHQSLSSGNGNISRWIWVLPAWLVHEASPESCCLLDLSGRATAYPCEALGVIHSTMKDIYAPHEDWGLAPFFHIILAKRPRSYWLHRFLFDWVLFLFCFKTGSYYVALHVLALAL